MLLCVSWMCKRTSEPSPYNCAFLRLTNYSAHLIKSSLYNTQTSICITLWWAATIGENLCLFISMLFNHKVTAFVLTVKTVGILTAVKLSLCCWLIWKITSFSGCMLTPCPAYWSIALLCKDWRVSCRWDSFWFTCWAISMQTFDTTTTYIFFALVDNLKLLCASSIVACWRTFAKGKHICDSLLH